MHKNSYDMIDEAAFEKKAEKEPLHFLQAVLRILETIDKYYLGGTMVYELPPRKAERLREELKDGIPIEFMNITKEEAYGAEGFLCTIPLLKGVLPEYRNYCNVRFDHNNQVFNHYKLPFHSEIKNFLAGYLKRKSEKWWDEGDRPTFEKSNGRIFLGNKFCQIPLSAPNKIAVCNVLFQAPPGEWVVENDFFGPNSLGEKNPNAMYDAARAVNKLIEKDFGIKDMIEATKKIHRARIRPGLFE